MANFEEIVVSLGLESKDFSTKVEALARQYDSFIKKFSEEPIVIKFDEKVGERFNALLNQAQQNLTKFASDIKQKFQLEFNPNIANLDEIKRAVSDRMASLQTQLDRSPLNVQIDPKIFSDAAKLLSVLEDIRKKEAAGGTAGTRDQERIASLTSNLTGLERIFNKGFFEKFNSDATTTVQRIDLLKTKVEQLTNLKAAQEKPNPAIQNLIKQLADLQKAFFSTQSVFPVLKELREDLDRVASTFKILQSTQGIPQEVISSFDKLAQTINELSAEEDQLRAADLAKSKEELEMETLFAVDAADKKAVIEEESLAKSQALKEKEVVIAKEAEEAKTQATREGTAARTTITSEGIDATISKIGKVALEFSGGQFSEPFQQIAKVSKDLSTQIDSNIIESEKFIAKLSGLVVPPNSVFSQKKLEENLALQKSLKQAYDDTVAAALRLKEADTLEKEARALNTAARGNREEGFSVQADAQEKEAAALSAQAASLTENFNLAASKLVQVKAEADSSFKALSTSFEKAQDKTFNETEVITSKLKVLEDEKTANLAKALEDRDRLAKISLFRSNSAEEQAIQRTITAREALNAKILALQKILEEQLAEASRSPAGLGAGRDQEFKTRISNAVSDITRAKTEIAAFGREEAKAVSIGGPFSQIFSGLTKNIFATAGQVVKFNLAWRATGLIVGSVVEPIKLVNATIERGVKFLTEFQQKTVEVRELLLQNAKFSNDLVENFNLANQSAQKLALSVQLASTKVNTSVEVFQQLLESFIQSGGLEAVGGSLQKAVDTVALLVQGLGSVGISLKDARRGVSEINKLLTQSTTARDALPRAFKRSSDELSGIIAKASKEGKLFEVVSNLLSNQAKTLELSDQNFSRLLDKAEVFFNLISGAFSKKIFEELLNLLQDLTAFFVENDKKILSFAEELGKPLGQLVGIFGDLTKIVLKCSDAFKAFGFVLKATFPLLKLLLDIIPAGIDAFKGLTGAIDEGVDRLQGKLKTISLSIGDSLTLEGFRDELLTNLDTINKLIVDKSKQFSDNLSANAKEVLVKETKALLDKRQEILTQVLKSDEVIAKLPVSSNAVGLRDFIERNFRGELRKAQRELPPEAQEVVEKVISAFESGLALGEKRVETQISNIVDQFQHLNAVTTTIEENFREKIETRFQDRLTSQSARTKNLLNSFQREFTDNLHSIDDAQRKVFGGVTDVRAFNDQFEKVNSRIAQITSTLNESATAVKTITDLSGKKIQVPVTIVPKSGKIITPEQKKQLESELDTFQRELDELNRKKKSAPGLSIPSIDKQIEQERFFDKQRLDATEKFQKNSEKLNQDQARTSVELRKKRFDADLALIQENLKNQEQLFAEVGNARLVDEKEKAEETARIRLTTLSAELKREIQAKKDSAHETDQFDRNRRIGELSREIEFLQELTALQSNVGLQKRLDAEKKFDAALLEEREKTALQLLQTQVSAQERTNIELLDQEKAFLELSRRNQIEALERRIQIAKSLPGFENSEAQREFARERKKIEEDFTNAVKVNADTRARAILKREDDIRKAAIQTLEVRKEALEEFNKVQELGFTTEKLRLQNQFQLAQVSRELASINLESAKIELERFRLRSRDTVAIQQQVQAVERLKIAELDARVAEESARRRANQTGFQRFVSGFTGRDRTQDTVARDVIGKLIGELQSQQEKLAPGNQAEFDRLAEEIENLRQKFVKLGDNLDQVNLAKFANDLNNAVTNIANGINAVISGFQQSGIGGAIGAGASFLGNLPGLKDTVFGQVAAAVGTVVSAVSSLFTALARRLAAQIQKSIDGILHDFERGFVDLGDTIVRLENERLKAISELSGKKGGQKELDKILPGLEDKIASLVDQQKAIQTSFDDQLTALRLGNDSLVEFHNKWKDVVATVKEYLGSFAQGEDLINAQAKAAEFLSLSLKKIKEDFQDQLADGEKEAIQEAIKLNDLFDERKKLLEELVKLQEDFNKAQFELLTADAIEVRQAGAVIRGNQIVQLRKEFETNKKEKEDRLKELDQEIAHQARIVAQQKQIFNLASDTASLKARSNALEEQSLQRQLDKFKEIKGVIDGIVQDASGNFTISPNLLAAAGINPNTLNPTTIRNTTINNPTFNINVPEGTDGTKFGQDMLQSWQNDNTRWGFNNA